jgi:hypothetical protein
MNTIFYDFGQFSAKKIWKKSVMTNFLHKLAAHFFVQKRLFVTNFGANYFLIRTIGPLVAYVF